MAFASDTADTHRVVATSGRRNARTSADLLVLQGVLCAGYWTTCWKVGRLTQGMEGTVPTPMALNWMSSSSGLHLARSLCPEPGSAPPVSLVREQVQVVGSLTNDTGGA